VPTMLALSTCPKPGEMAHKTSKVTRQTKPMDLDLQPNYITAMSEQDLRGKVNRNP
jgi:hypothetical protein